MQILEFLDVFCSQISIGDFVQFLGIFCWDHISNFGFKIGKNPTFLKNWKKIQKFKAEGELSGSKKDIHFTVRTMPTAVPGYDA